MTRPGNRLRRLAARICDDASMTKVIDPILADLQWEDAQAASSGPWRRRAVRGRAHLAFWRALTLQVWNKVNVPQLSATSSRAGGELARMVIVTILLVTGLFLGWSFTLLRQTESFNWATASDWIRLLAYVTPQALGIGIPSGLLIGATVVVVGRRSSRTWLPTLIVACSCSALALVVQEWVTPRTNRAFTMLTYRQVIARTEWDVTPPPPTPNSSMLSRREINEQLAQAREFKQLNLPLKRGEIGLWVDYHLRVALPVASLVFGFLALSLSSIARGRVVGLTLALLSVVGWWSTASSARRFAYDGTLSPLAAAWAPNLVALVLALVLIGLVALRARFKHSAA